MPADRRLLALLGVSLSLGPAAHAGSERVWRPGEEQVEQVTPEVGPEHARFAKLRDHRYSERFAVERIAVAADGSEIVALTRASREGPRSWDLGTGRSLDLPVVSRDAATVAWAPGKDLLALSIRSDVLSGERAGVQLVRVSDGSSAGFLEGGATASGLAFSPDGARLAAATGEGVLIWTLPGGRPELAVPIPDGADTVSWVSPSELMVSGDGGARLLRASVSGEILESWNGKRSDGPVAFSPTGQLVAVGDVNFVKVLDLWDGGGTQKVPVTGTVNALGWSLSGAVFVAGTDEGLVHVFAVDGVRGIDFVSGASASGGSRRASAPADVGDRTERASDRTASRTEDPNEIYDLRGSADPLDRGGSPTTGGGGAAGGFGSAELQAEISVLLLEQMGGDPRSAASVEAALKKNLKRLEPCWKKQARAGKVGAGKLVLEMGVTPNGEGVAIDAPLQDDLGNDKLLECLRDRLREPLFGSGLGSLQVELTIDLRLR